MLELSYLRISRQKVKKSAGEIAYQLEHSVFVEFVIWSM